MGESYSVPTQTYFRWLTTGNTSAFAALESRNAKKKMTIVFHRADELCAATPLCERLEQGK